MLHFGLAVERGFASGRPPYAGVGLAPDWDWHRLTKLCAKGTALDGELRRLLRGEGFVAIVAGSDTSVVLDRKSFRSAAQIRTAAPKCPTVAWAGFDLCYRMSEEELKACTGRELVEAILAGFAEVAPAMNLCMQVPLAPGRAS